MIQSSLCLETNQTDSTKITLRYTNIVCQSIDLVLVTNVSCSIKAYSRTYSTFNFAFTITKSLMKILVKVKVEYKYGTIYREGNKNINCYLKYKL